MQIKKLIGVILLMTFLGILPLLFSEEVRIISEINAAEENNKVLLFIRHAIPGTSSDNELMINEEVNVMSSMLENAGFEVIVTSASGEPLEGQSTKLIPDIKLADVNVEDYTGIMMPCFAVGATGSGWHASPEEISLVKEAVSLGKPIAAQRGAIIMLAEAGALEGKKYAYTTDLKYYGKGFANAIYSGDGVIQDGNVITSSKCPYYAKYYGHDHGTSELTELFIATIQK